jgi:putative ABC transport system permease protein
MRSPAGAAPRGRAVGEAGEAGAAGAARRGTLERLLRARILGPAIEEQVAEEIDLHVELLARELEAEGMSAARARAEAAQRFSDRAQVAASCVRIARGTERRWRWRAFLTELGQDIRYGLRQLGRAPSFAVVALLTLAAGIGATTAIFSVVEGVVLRRFPFAHPERVVSVRESWNGTGSSFSVGNFVDLRAAAAGGFTELAALRWRALNLPEGAAGEAPARVLALQVTRGFFGVFGVQPQLGRTWRAEEDEPGREPVAVLSHGLWQEHFGGDAGILGRTLHLSGRAYRVIGVMPAGFDPTLSHEEIWLPVAFTPAERAQHDDHFLEVVGLLRPGVSAAASRDEMSAAMRRLAALYPEANVGRTGVLVTLLAEDLVGPYRQQLFVLLGAVGLVLLIACANVASLLLARGSARGRELAIRAAVGAGGRRIVRQLLTESVVLALGGGVLGVGLAAAAVRLFVLLAPAGIPRAGETRIDGAVLLFALAVSMAASLVFGMAPALRAARQDPQTLLRGGSAARAAARDRVRSLLVATEIALALTLLTGAGLLIRSAVNLERTPTGFDTAHLSAGRLSLPESSYPRTAAVAQTFAAMAERLAEAPGVRAAAAVSSVPLGPNGGSNGLVPEGRPFNAQNLIDARLHLVTPGYFATMGIPLEAGRPLAPGDTAGQPLVMVISRALARQAWGDADPVGKRIACCDGGPREPSWKTVVGVVGDVRTRGPAQEVVPEFYLPIGQAPALAWTWIQRTMTLVARGGDPALVAGALRATVRAADPSLPLTLTTMDEQLRGTTAEARFHTVLLLVLGLLGLFLAAVGTYGVVAYFVGLRRQEIGIRMALGAQRRDILALLGWQGARPVAGGLLAGAAGALAATRWLQSSLYGVSPTDPWTFACVILVLAATASLAVLLPASEATRIDPKQAIQQG